MILLPLTLMAWLFVSWDAVDRLCRKFGWQMRQGIGMAVWTVLGLAGGFYLMNLFHAF